MIVKNRGNIVEFNNATMFKNTHYSDLYFDGDKLIKVYDDDKAPSHVRLTEGVFKSLSSINCDAFLKLRDCYVEELNLDGYLDDAVTAYSYDYIENVDKKMIDMPMEYTIESLYRFRELVELLNMRRVAIRDAHGENVLVTENGLVVIDPDMYYSSPEVHNTNLQNVNEYIVDLWGDEYGLSYGDKENRNKIRELFYYTDVDSYIDMMIPRLNEKTPRDLIEKVLSR